MIDGSFVSSYTRMPTSDVQGKLQVVLTIAISGNCIVGSYFPLQLGDDYPVPANLSYT